MGAPRVFAPETGRIEGITTTDANVRVPRRGDDDASRVRYGWTLSPTKISRSAAGW